MEAVSLGAGGSAAGRFWAVSRHLVQLVDARLRLGEAHVDGLFVEPSCLCGIALDTAAGAIGIAEIGDGHAVARDDALLRPRQRRGAIDGDAEALRIDVAQPSVGAGVAEVGGLEVERQRALVVDRDPDAVGEEIAEIEISDGVAASCGRAVQPDRLGYVDLDGLSLQWISD